MSFKRVKVLLGILAIALLTSCGTGELGFNTKINEDGSGQIVLKTKITGAFKEAAQQENSNEINEYFNVEGVETKSYAEGDAIINESSKKFKSPSELNSIFSKAKDDGFKINIQEKKGIFKNNYTYKLNAPKDFTLDELTKSLDTGEAQEIMSAEEMASFLGSAITLSNSVTVPGKVISSNATKTEGNTLSWSYTLAQVDPSKDMSVQYEVINKTNILIASGAAIAIILIIILLIVMTKPKKVKKVKRVIKK